MAASGASGSDPTTELALLHAQVDLLTTKLGRAERAVAQAHTAAAAAQAHRRADALLLELEAAEQTLRTCQKASLRQQRRPKRLASPAPVQDQLFDLG